MSLKSVVLFRSLVAVALTGTSLAQVQVDWSTLTGGGPGTPETASASAVDGAGALFVVGSRDMTLNGGTALDAVLTKIDAQGVVEWERLYDEPTAGSQAFEFVGVDAAGNVLVAGASHTGTATIVARYDTSGNQTWVRSLIGPSGQSARISAMRVAPSGDVVLVGNIRPALPSADAFVARIRPDGTTAWSRVYAATPGGGDVATDVVLDAAGNAYVTGQAGIPPNFTAGIFALKIALDGSLAWSAEFLPPATGHHQSPLAAVDAQGRLFVADRMTANNLTFVSLVLFDANGVRLWDRQVPDGDQVAGIAVRADGSVLVGASMRTGPFAGHAFVGAWDATGASSWSATYDPDALQIERLTDLDLDPTGGAILTGSFKGDITNVVFAAHVTDAGQQDWTQVVGSGQPAESAAELHVAADDSLRLHSRWVSNAADMRTRVRRLEHDVTAFCSGDGSATACPCGNSGSARSGCANSLGAGAVFRWAYGSASIALDSLYLTCTGLPPTTVTCFQGTERVAGGAGVVFGDGLRCAGGSVVRVGTRSANLGFATFPGAPLSLSVLGNVTSPGLRTYQCWYRNSASFCTPDTFNLSNGLAVLWRP